MSICTPKGRLGFYPPPPDHLQHTEQRARSSNPREDERSESERLASDVRSHTVYGRPEAAINPHMPHRSRTPRRRSRSHHRIKTRGRLGHSPRLDMVAKKAGRTFLISSWRDDQARLREGAVYTGCQWLLDTEGCEMLCMF
jgi:hypothetical protein